MSSEHNTTTCFDCGNDYRDRDMMPLPDEGELCAACWDKRENTKHTPGPWYAANCGNDEQGLIVSEVSDSSIAVAYDKRDAALIASAPELLAALEAALPLLEASYHDHNEAGNTLNEAVIFDGVEQARAAIAKARA